MDIGRQKQRLAGRCIEATASGATRDFSPRAIVPPAKPGWCQHAVIRIATQQGRDTGVGRGWAMWPFLGAAEKRTCSRFSTMRQVPVLPKYTAGAPGPLFPTDELRRHGGSVGGQTRRPQQLQQKHAALPVGQGVHTEEGTGVVQPQKSRRSVCDGLRGAGVQHYSGILRADLAIENAAPPTTRIPLRPFPSTRQP